MNAPAGHTDSAMAKQATNFINAAGALLTDFFDLTQWNGGFLSQFPCIIPMRV